MWTRTAAVATALLLTLSACGSDEDATASKAISDTLVDSGGDNGSSAFFALQREEADCVGDGFVDQIGVEKLQEYGLVSKDGTKPGAMQDVTMSADDAESAVDTLFECTDVAALMNDAFGQSPNIDATMRACLKETLDEKLLRSIFTSFFTGKTDEVNTLLGGPLTTCVTLPQG